MESMVDSHGPGTGSSAASTDERQVAAALADFVRNTPADLAVALTSEGHLLAVAGASQSYDLVSVSALAAGDIALNQQLMAMMQPPDRSKELLIEGEGHSILLSEVGGRLILMGVIAKDVLVGWARLQMQTLKEGIPATYPASVAVLGFEDRAQVDQALSQLVGEATSGLWID
jgi:predicted regulator of Ras-like GTPase activity (Roadblock/LC7/MglB family)